MSFSSEIKAQLCRVETQCSYCVAAELAGILEFSAQIKDGLLKCVTENAQVSQRLLSDFEQEFPAVDAIHSDDTKKNHQFYLEDEAVLENVMERLCLFDETDIFLDIIKLRCCTEAYVRGCFLGGGSVSDPEKGYHIEFDTRQRQAAEHLHTAMERLDCRAKMTYRKGRYIVYAKECETVAELLAKIGAGVGVMRVYNVQIEKEMRNTVNRQVNCETANVDKIVKASLVQVNAIELIRKKVGLETLPDTLYEAAAVRLEYPEESLKELAARLGIGKSGMNHRLQRLLELAEDLKGKEI